MLARTPLWRHLSFTSSLAWRGRTALVPIVNGLGAENRTLSEPWMLPLLERLFARRQGAFVDVGTNLGQTLLKVLLVDPWRPYVGFDPSVECVAYTEAVARANDAPDVRCFAFGLAAAPGIVPLFAVSPTDRAATIVEGFRDTTENPFRSYAPVQRGDDVFRGLGLDAIAVVKLDVEGAEWDVLDGLQETLRQYRPFVLAEILPTYDESTHELMARRERADRIVALMHGLDYTMARACHDDGTLVPLDAVEAHGDIEACDYLFAPT